MFKQIERNNRIFESEEFKKDKYKFNIVYKILSGEEVLLYSDEENYFLARNKVGMPTWIWTKDGLGKDKYEEIKQAMDMYLTDIEYDQFTCKKEFYDYLKESKYEKFNSTVYFEMGFLTCEKVKEVKKVEGQMQLATEEDLEDMSKVLYKFIIFMNDTLKIDEEVVISQAKEMAEELIKEKRFYCWKNNSGKIVSIAKYEEKEGTARIGHVYTVEEERGKGYAANLIHDLTEILLEKGLKVLLYTDYNYKASNKAYINAGYEDKGILITFSCSK